MKANQKTQVPAQLSVKTWLKQILAHGEHYAGVVIGDDGMPSHHLILMNGEATGINWQGAVEWAKKAGGDLPTRQEQALLYSNAKKQFQPRWYWSSEQHATYSDYAWGQNFVNGSQDGYGKSYEGRARAVRRLVIE